MIVNKQLIFWVLIWVILTVFLNTSLESIVVSFYFVTMLMPVVIATSLFFNRYLVSQFLLKKRTKRFLVYVIYMLIVSIYLELLVMVLAFVVLADYEIANLGSIAGDVYILTILLYLIVFAEGMILSIQSLRESHSKLESMKSELLKKKTEEITIKVDRKNVNLNLIDIKWIESLGDYVKVHSDEATYITKEKISSLEKRLSNQFIRIHRSFLVNKTKIQSYTKQMVVIDDEELTIGRKFKESVEKSLTASTPGSTLSP